MKRKPTIEVPMGFAAIADAMGQEFSRQRVWAWFQPGRRVPAERVLEVERITGIPRHVLRQDIYPNPSLSKSKPQPHANGEAA